MFEKQKIYNRTRGRETKREREWSFGRRRGKMPSLNRKGRNQKNSTCFCSDFGLSWNSVNRDAKLSPRRRRRRGGEGGNSSRRRISFEGVV